jgi:hydroxyethylthiazole kinase-like uncharacterized protein yjeF
MSNQFRMKILTSAQIREWDQYTIAHEPISSIDLMERASLCFVQWFVHNYPDSEIPVHVVCGNGNNGGDGLAVARLLRDRFYEVHVYVYRISVEDSVDFDINLGRLMKYGDVSIEFIHDRLPEIASQGIIIDALLGTGTNKPLAGMLKELVMHINKQKNTIISIDMPSGMPAEGVCTGVAVRPDHIFTFQTPKWSFFIRENEKFCSLWTVANIGLHPDYLHQVNSNTYYIDNLLAKSIYKTRTRFQHKGDFGHALIVAGSEGKIGAAILATKACLKSGAGLVTACVPQIGREIIHETVPEAMVVINGYQCFSNFSSEYSGLTLGIGPGLGTHPKTVKALSQLLSKQDHPLVIDADGLNIMASNSTLWDFLPANSIITPHPKEFDRLFGKSEDETSRHTLARNMAKKHAINIVLKGAYTRIFTKDGLEYINSTGNPGMATAGSGDVLTGIITALLAQNYSPENAAVLGVFVHGLAGDLALTKQSYESLNASDIIDHVGMAFKQIQAIQ